MGQVRSDVHRGETGKRRSGGKEITIQTEQQGSTVSIIAKSIEGDGVASLDVYVPRNATLHVSSGDGSLHLDGVSGDLTLRTGDGSIEVSEGHGQLQVNTGDGSIKVGNFEGNVDARTGDGSISLDGKFSELSARTGDGSISLSVPANSDSLLRRMPRHRQCRSDHFRECHVETGGVGK